MGADRVGPGTNPRGDGLASGSAAGAQGRTHGSHCSGATAIRGDSVARVSRMSPTPSGRARLSRSARLALLLGTLAVASACVDNGKITAGAAGSTTTTEAASAPETSTSTTPTTAAGESGSGSGDDDSPAGSPTSAPSVVDADQEYADPAWDVNATEFRGQDGLLVAYDCPPDGALSSLWGTGPFTDDSSVCTAGVFAGRITPVEGGRVVIEIAPGEDEYAAGETNGAVAAEYGVWAGSFIVR